MVYVWGDKGQEYVGRSMTLYCDPTVKFGGLEVGGIRISHMSHLEKEIVMALTASKSNKRPFTVKPLVEAIDYAFEALKQGGRDAAGQGGAALDEWILKIPSVFKKRIGDSIGAELRKIAGDVDAQSVIEQKS